MSIKPCRLAKCIAGMISVSVLAIATSAGAQASDTRIPRDGSNGDGMDTHLYRPAVDSKGFFHVNGTDIIGHNDFSFGMFLDWGHTLLRTNDPDAPAAADPGVGANSDGLCDNPNECAPASSGSGTKALIADSFTGTISGSYGIKNVAVIGLSLPITIMIGDPAYGIGPTGATYNTNQHDPQKLTTIIPHLKIRLLRVQKGFGLALVAQGGIPIAKSPYDLAGDPKAWYWPRLVGETRFLDNRFRVGMEAGFRGNGGKTSSFGLDVAGNPQLKEGELNSGNLVTWGLGLSWRAIKRLDLVAEHYGTFLTSKGTATDQALSGEYLGGAKLFIEENSYLMAAGGSRVHFNGYEAADARVVLGFVYEPTIGDRDGDGLRDDVDACPDDPEDFDNFEDSDGCPELDNDNDGILDKQDRCPNVPEDKDGHEDHDGCPEGEKRSDRDGDGIYDDVDKCPDDPEDFDNFEDEDGCPEHDNDKDGIPDKKDQCPDDPEDFDKFEDHDGCPEPDNDLDRILDVVDKCPNDPETYNGFEDEDGCPDKGKVIIDGNDILILEKINFATGSDKILPGSDAIVDAVAATLKGHPEFLVIEVAGHADERGDDAYNLDLTQRRAASVRAAMNARGISNNRMVSQGYGEYCPLDTASSHAAWEKNRRVDFKVVKTEDGPTRVKRGCTAARDAGIFPPTVN